MKFEKKQFIGIIFAIIMAGISGIFIEKIGESLFYFILVISFIVAVLPFITALITQQGHQKEKESKFLEFTRDLVEGVKTGTPINKGIINLQDRNYGTLSPHIKKLANQIGIGIGLDGALKTFAKEAKSIVISRAVTLISEAQKAGGDIGNILESVSQSVNQTEELKKEQKSSVSNLVVQGYIIFLVFIVIMLVLQYAILPIATGFNGEDSGLLGGDENVQPPEDDEDISLPLFILLLVQSIFAGLIIGNISEGKVMSGIKHSFILLTITLVVVTGAKVLLG